MTDVFDNPWLLLTVAAILLVPAAIARQARPQWGYRPLLVPLLVALLGLGLDFFVQTDKEKIHAILSDCRRAAIAGDIGPINAAVCERYNDGFHRSRDDFIAAAERGIQQAAIAKVRFQRLDLTLQEQQAVMEIDAVVHLSDQSRYAQYGSLLFVSLWLEFAKQPSGDWCIARAGVTAVNNQPVNWGAVPR